MKECLMCGYCCKIRINKIPTKQKEMIKLGMLKETHRKTVKIGPYAYQIFTDYCIMLEDNNKCSIQEQKPKICKKTKTPLPPKIWKQINPDCGYL